MIIDFLYFIWSAFIDLNIPKTKGVKGNNKYCETEEKKNN